MTSSTVPTDLNAKITILQMVKAMCHIMKVHVIFGTFLFRSECDQISGRNDIYRELTTQLHDT